MNNLGDYPLGAKYDPRAPYNEKTNPDVEIEVYIWKEIGKKVKVKVNDYSIISEGLDEDGDYYKELDFSTCDIWSAVSSEFNNPNGWEEITSDIEIDSSNKIYN